MTGGRRDWSEWFLDWSLEVGLYGFLGVAVVLTPVIVIVQLGRVL